MHRKNFLLNTGILTAGSLLFRNKSFANFFGRYDYTVKMLRNNVGIFLERGGSIGFLISKDGNLVIDSQFPDTAAHLIADIQKRNSSPIKYLLNTHHHGDHSGGNIAFKGIAEHVMAHENSLKNQKTVAEKNKTEDKQLYPDQTYTNIWREKIGKERICVQYYGAAHTNGDSFVHFERSNIVHCGDLVFNRRHPYVDRGAGANIKSWINVLNTAIDKFDRHTIYIFGHSANGFKVTGTVDDVKAFRDYLGNVLKFVEAEMKAGKTKEEILKATIIPGGEEWKTDGIQRPLGAAFDELSEK